MLRKTFKVTVRVVPFVPSHFVLGFFYSKIYLRSKCRISRTERFVNSGVLISIAKGMYHQSGPRKITWIGPKAGVMGKIYK